MGDTITAIDTVEGDLTSSLQNLIHPLQSDSVPQIDKKTRGNRFRRRTWLTNSIACGIISRIVFQIGRKIETGLKDIGGSLARITPRHTAKTEKKK